VLFHLLAITAGSLPVLVDERGLDREAWQDPLVQNEFRAWAERIREWGIEVGPADVEAAAWRFARVTLAANRRVTAIFEPYYRWLGTRQRWRMFPAAVERPVRFVIEIDPGTGIWEPVYRMGWGGEEWGARWFDRDRMRAALNLYAWGISAEGYDDLVTWLEAEVGTSFPGAERMRVGFVPVRVMGFDGAWREAQGAGKQWRVVQLDEPAGE